MINFHAVEAVDLSVYTKVGRLALLSICPIELIQRIRYPFVGVILRGGRCTNERTEGGARPSGSGCALRVQVIQKPSHPLVCIWNEGFCL